MSELLWTPSPERIERANLTAFMGMVNAKRRKALATYGELYQWSIERPDEFWADVWEYGGVIYHQPYEQVVADLDKMPGARWFTGSTLNFAENLLKRRDDHPALVFNSEWQVRRTLTYAELYDQVARLARSRKALGVVPGDRVAGFMPNMPEATIGMLAAASLGAVWSSCSPDFGLQGVMDRFGQIQPKVLLTADGYFYNGKTFDCLAKVAQVQAEIRSIERVVVVPYVSDAPDLTRMPGAVRFADFLAPGKGLAIDFAPQPFDHPRYIMYSSGTTGVPKCIVRGAGGTLLQHLKEHQLQADVKPEDRLFYFTTCGWMMWNWLASGLASGCTLLLFEGSPFSPDPGGAIFRFA